MHRLVATRKFAHVLATVAVVTSCSCGGAPGTSSQTQPTTNGSSRAVVIADFSEPSILPADAGTPPMPYREAIDGLATSRSSLDCRSGRYARYQGALDGSFTSKSKQQLLLWVGDECDIPVAKWAPLLEGAVVERGRVVARFTSDRFSIQSIADVDHDGLTDVLSPEGQLYSLEQFRSLLVFHAHLPPRELCAAVFADLAAYRGRAEQYDDMTMLVLGIE